MDSMVPQEQQQRRRILIVDRSRGRAGVIARRLTDAGYRVSAAASAPAALAELYRLPVDLVLADLESSPLSGVEIVRAIRSEVQWNDMPIMLITGKTQTRNMVLAYAAGADDVILKPFLFEVLFARMERRMAHARSIKRLREDNAALDARIVKRAIEIGELRHKLIEERARGSLAL